MQRRATNELFHPDMFPPEYNMYTGSEYLFGPDIPQRRPSSYGEMPAVPDYYSGTGNRRPSNFGADISDDVQVISYDETDKGRFKEMEKVEVRFRPDEVAGNLLQEWRRGTVKLCYKVKAEIEQPKEEDPFVNPLAFFTDPRRYQNYFACLLESSCCTCKNTSTILYDVQMENGKYLQGVPEVDIQPARDVSSEYGNGTHSEFANTGQNFTMGTIHSIIGGYDCDTDGL